MQHRAARRVARRFVPFFVFTLLWSAVLGPAATAETTRNRVPTKPLKPLPVKLARGIPTLTPYSGAPAGKLPPRRSGSEGSLLDEVGELKSPVSPELIADWRHKAFSRKTPRAMQSKLLVWLGEVELAKNFEPGIALRLFRKAQRKSRSSSTTYGLAAYDAGIALYTRGAYGKAAGTFKKLLEHRPALKGFSRGRCALFFRHASAAAGYHAERARIGIPEPDRLDPICAAAGLAVCLRAHNLPYGKKHILSACRVTGRGSNLQDILNACKKLGVSGRALTADEKGLIALPKPLIAYVEHDHYLAVTRADKRGVSYLCADCGRWPGGQIDLSWKQWRTLEATLYVSVARKGSPEDMLLGQLTDLQRAKEKGVRTASASMSPAFGQKLTALAMLQTHVTLYLSRAPIAWCGALIAALRRTPFNRAAMDGDPVNLATGEEEYTTAPDLTVYNPSGPSVYFGRIYNSLRDPDIGYESDDFGVGWTQSYNVMVHDPTSAQHLQIVVGTSNNLLRSGTDVPATGLQWDIIQGGATIATSASPGGWGVVYQTFNQTFTITVPGAASPVMDYEVRYKSGSTVASGWFDVLATYTVLPGGTVSFPNTGSLSPGGGAWWDILYSGNVIASSITPNGWSATANSSNGRITVVAPSTATVATGYLVRTYVGYVPRSANFNVIASRFVPRPGAKYLVYPNGGRLQFTAPSVPTVSQPAVSCTMSGGAAVAVEWDYDASNQCGHYVITQSDRSKWITTSSAKILIDGGGNPEGWSYVLSQMVDRLGHAINFNYGATGPSGFPLLSTITQADTGATILAITRATDGTGNILAVSDAYGRSVYYHESAISTGSPPYVYTYHLVDQVSQLVPTGTSSPPLAASYGYSWVKDGQGTGSLPRLTTISVVSPTGSGMSTSTIAYDVNTSVVTSHTDGNGNKRAYSIVDANHTKVTVTNSAGAVSFSYTAGFNSSMNETTRTDGTNSTVVSNAAYSDPYNPNGPSTVTDGNGKVTGCTWDQFGNLLTSTSPRGTVTTYTYDYSTFSLGRLLSVQEGTKTATTFAYYEPGGLVQTVTGPQPGGGGTVSSSFTYDSLANVLTVTRPGNGTVTSMTTTFNYTTDGTYSQAAAIGQPLTVANNLGETTHFRYDARANRTVVVDPAGIETDASYNLADQPLQITYPATGQTGTGRGYATSVYLYTGGPITAVRAYDESNVLVRQMNYAYGQQGELLNLTGSADQSSYSYDASYRTAAIVDGDGNSVSYSYNSKGFPASVAYPNGTTQFSSYDSAGNILTRVDARGITTNFLYNDADGLLSDIQYPASTSLNVHLTYDAYGRVSSRTDGEGSYSFAYDELNGVTSTTTTYTGLPSKTIYYSFNPDGSRSSMGTPAGNFAYSYDGVGRAASMGNPYGESTSWNYLTNGWLWKQTQSNAVNTVYTFNALGLPTDILTKDGSGATLSDFSGMTYDGVGNRTSVSASIAAAPSYSGLTTFSYDSKDQLVQEISARNGGYTDVFGYDLAGNATTIRGITHTYSSSNQDTGNTYDGNGNPTTYQGVAVTYDAENALKSVGSAFTAGYSAESNRVWKQGTGNRTYFLYDGDQPVVEMNSSGAVTATNTFGADGLVSRNSGGSSTFYSFDDQGSVAQRLDSAAAVLTNHFYDAYGVGSPNAAGDPFGHGAKAGRYTDNETGLQYAAASYYDPAATRYINRNPAGPMGGINPYTYALNNPSNAINHVAATCAPNEGLILIAAKYWDNNGMAGSGRDAAHAFAEWTQGRCSTYDMTLAQFRFLGHGLLHALPIASKFGPLVGGAGPPISYRLGSPVLSEAAAGGARAYDWALSSPLERATTVVEKYGINLRGSGQSITLSYDASLPTGTFGYVSSAEPTVINFGPHALSSEQELATTIAHELRHARAYLGSGSNSETAARASERALRSLIRGRR